MLLAAFDFTPPPVPRTAKKRPDPAPFTGLRRCGFNAKALYTTRGCRNIQEFEVEVFEISPTQVRIRGRLAAFLPEYFALILGARQYGIGCSVVGRNRDTVTCNLIRRENLSMVAFLANIRDPNETTRLLQHPLFPRSRMQVSV